MTIHKCYFCNFQSRNLTDLKRHILKKKKCSYLLKSEKIILEDINDYYKLVELHKTDPNNEIWGLEEIKEDINIVHGNKKEDKTDEGFKCDDCGKKFNRKDNLKRHIITCKKKLSNELDIMIENKKKDIENNIIEYKFIDNNVLKNIILEIKDELIAQNLEIKLLKNQVKLLENKNDCINTSNLSPNIIELENDTYKCSNCNFITDDVEALNIHLKNVCSMNNNFNNIYELDVKTFGKNIYGKNAGEIYIIQTDFINKQHFKIGKTTLLKQRLAQYRCGSTYEPRLHYYYPFKNILDIDEKLKNKLETYKFKNEIYIAELDILRKLISDLQRETENGVLEYKPNITDNLLKCEKCNCVCMNDSIFLNHSC